MLSVRRLVFVLASFLGLLPGIPAGAAPAAAAELNVQTMEIESAAAGYKLKYRVYLPAGYENSARRYPVLYLLHGVNGSYWSWDEALKRASTALARNAMIIVTPDAGNSWYADWARSDDGRPHQWERYISEELVAHVDAHFRTIARRAGRAIHGFSMGGYGALTIGLRHPERYASIGSTSGYLSYGREAVDSLQVETRIRKPQLNAAAKSYQAYLDQEDPAIDIAGFKSRRQRTPQGEIFMTAEQAKAHDPFRLLARLPEAARPHVSIFCGMNDSLLPVSQEFAALLITERARFTYRQIDGGHDAELRRRTMTVMLAGHLDIMEQALTAEAQSEGREY